MNKFKILDSLIKLIFYLTLVIGMFFENNLAQNTTDFCLKCHKANGDKAAVMFTKDIHYEMGVSCADCHGGDQSKSNMGEAMSEKNNFIGVPKGNRISELCSQCHSDEYQNLINSVHGKLTIKGDQIITQCITCHGIHNILRKEDKNSNVNALNVAKICAGCHSNIAYIKKYNPELPTDQYEKYLTSKHGILNSKKDPKAASCVSCHGSHEIRNVNDVKSKVYASNLPEVCSVCHSDSQYMKDYKIPTDQYDKYIGSVHGIALLKKGDLAAPSCNDCHGNHGAAPPGVESISKVCGICHALNAELFAKSPHKKAFDTLNKPECETCHGNHEIIVGTDQLIGNTKGTICYQCHNENQNVEGFIVAGKMRAILDSLVKLEETTVKLITDAEQKGMEVSEAKFKLRDIRQAKLETRTIIHAFNFDTFEKTSNNALSLIYDVKNLGEKAVNEYYFRRWGLLAATAIISVLAITLFIYIKKLEKKSNGK